MSGNRKILIVDDNELNLKLCSAILKSNYEILTAKTAEEGLESARRTHPDLILMDIQLPGMDGLTATQAIKSDDDLKAIPVVALTSFAMVGDREKALSAGCEEYLAKPIEIQGLKSMVARLLGDPAEGRSVSPTAKKPEPGKVDLALS
jgi:two-component system, cell cycle response regulator DivK